MSTCELDACDLPRYRTLPLCTLHYFRKIRYGSENYQPKVLAHDITGKRYGALVALHKQGSKWLCRCDCGAERLCTVGALNAGQHAHCGNRTLHGRVHVPTYRSLHTRLRAARGSAAAHPCVDCGGTAAHWSYDYTDPNPLRDADGKVYSIDLDRYEPRCRSCHARFDYGRPGDGRAARRPAGSQAGIR